ncbi:MAG: transposase [Acetobacteraceae bacterium]|nr:transposase [Acetobacteraceae bacterium]
MTPKEHSTAGKQRLGKISREGNERLRALLVNGATSVVQRAVRPGAGQGSTSLLGLLQRRPRKLVAVALANKMAPYRCCG